MEHAITKEELTRRQALPLSEKIEMSQCIIEQWWKHWDEQVYVSFSGGKDSTVLLHLVRSLFPDVPAVFIDTGLEYPEIKEFVKATDNVITIRPKLSFRQVIEKWGYPIVSKEQARYLFEYRTSKSEKLKSTRWNGGKNGGWKISEKWKFLVNAPFIISHKCCDALKKAPIKKFEKAYNKKPYIGTMAADSRRRFTDYLLQGCNVYNMKSPSSKPLSFWTEQDIMEYIQTYNVPMSTIYSMGYKRTGCMFCMFGTHLEKEPNKFQLMKNTHPKLYRYCMDDLGLHDVMTFAGIKHE